MSTQLVSDFVARHQGQTVGMTAAKVGLPKVKVGRSWQRRSDDEVLEVFRAVVAAGLGRIEGQKLEVFPVAVEQPSIEERASKPQPVVDAAVEQFTHKAKAMTQNLTHQKSKLAELHNRASTLMAQLRELNSAQANLRVQPAPYTVPQGDLAQQLIAAAKRDRTEAANLAEAEAFERNLRAETERKRDEVAKELDAASAAIADAEAAIEADKAELRRLLTEFEAHTEGLKACYQALLGLEQRGNIDRSDLVMWVYPLKWPRVMPPKGGVNGATTYIDDAMGWYTQP